MLFSHLNRTHPILCLWDEVSHCRVNADWCARRTAPSSRLRLLKSDEISQAFDGVRIYDLISIFERRRREIEREESR
jgi:hypothetical protein